MQREMSRILQEVSVQPQQRTSSSADGGSHHAPFYVATEEGTLTDLLTFGPPLVVEPSTTTTPTDGVKTATTSHVHDTPASKLMVDGHHLPYQAMSDGALFDLETYDSCNQDSYQNAMEHSAERMAALEHDRMERKEDKIVQQAAGKRL
jgi:hypothetical protein